MKIHFILKFQTLLLIHLSKITRIEITVLPVNFLQWNQGWLIKSIPLSTKNLIWVTFSLHRTYSSTISPDKKAINIHSKIILKM